MRLTKEELRNLEIIVKYGESDWSEHPEGFEALAKNYHNDLIRLLAHVESLPTDQPMWGIWVTPSAGSPSWLMAPEGVLFAAPNHGQALAQRDSHFVAKRHPDWYQVRQFGPDGKPMEEL